MQTLANVLAKPCLKARTPSMQCAKWPRTPKRWLVRHRTAQSKKSVESLHAPHYLLTGEECGLSTFGLLVVREAVPSLSDQAPAALAQRSAYLNKEQLRRDRSQGFTTSRYKAS